MRIVDIAAAAGVSPSTVSRVINGNARISPETVAHVRKVMKDMGYIPHKHRYRKHLSSSKMLSAEQIAVVSFGPFSLLDSASCNMDLNSLSDAIVSRGHQMVYVHIQDEHDIPEDILNTVTGMIFLNGNPNSAIYEHYSNLPIVSLYSPDTTEGDQILSGHHSVGKMAVTYLRQQGVDNLVVLNPFPEHPIACELTRGFIEYCQKENLPSYRKINYEDEGINTFSLKASKQMDLRIEPLIDKLLDNRSGKIGAFIPCDWMTSVAYRHLRKRNLKPGLDVIFISAGHNTLSLLGLYPKPATIDIGINSMAQRAVDLLMIRKDNPSPQRCLKVSIEPELILGESL